MCLCFTRFFPKQLYLQPLPYHLPLTRGTGTRCCLLAIGFRSGHEAGKLRVNDFLKGSSTSSDSSKTYEFQINATVGLFSICCIDTRHYINRKTLTVENPSPRREFSHDFYGGQPDVHTHHENVSFVKCNEGYLACSTHCFI